MRVYVYEKSSKIAIAVVTITCLNKQIKEDKKLRANIKAKLLISFAAIYKCKPKSLQIRLQDECTFCGKIMIDEELDGLYNCTNPSCAWNQEP